MAEMGSAASGLPLPPQALTNNPPENTLEDEEYKHRPPYHNHSTEEFGPIKWKGACQCGRITFRLKQAQPLNAKFCHCRGCQVMHGAPFQWATIFHKEDVSFTNGSSGLDFFSAAHNSQKYETPTKVSCNFCHTLIMDEGRNVCLLFPQLINFGGSREEQRKQLEAFKPSCHIFYEQRMFDVPDGTPKWSGMNGDSQLLDDAGQPIKQ